MTTSARGKSLTKKRLRPAKIPEGESKSRKTSIGKRNVSNAAVCGSTAERDTEVGGIVTKKKTTFYGGKLAPL